MLKADTMAMHWLQHHTVVIEQLWNCCWRKARMSMLKAETHWLQHHILAIERSWSCCSREARMSMLKVDTYGNALATASYCGHRAIVELLLERGADVNAQGGYYGNVLQAASHGGRPAIVELLLEKLRRSCQGSYSPVANFQSTTSSRRTLTNETVAVEVP
jgi:hypothetical protein